MFIPNINISAHTTCNIPKLHKSELPVILLSHRKYALGKCFSISLSTNVWKMIKRNIEFQGCNANTLYYHIMRYCNAVVLVKRLYILLLGFRMFNIDGATAKSNKFTMSTMLLVLCLCSNIVLARPNNNVDVPLITKASVPKSVSFCLY